jgi:hypothetical protein
MQAAAMQNAKKLTAGRKDLLGGMGDSCSACYGPAPGAGAAPNLGYSVLPG